MTFDAPSRDLVEVSFDGIVGPTHNYAGLSPGNLASTGHRGDVSNPKAAALEGLRKMELVASLGALQAVLPPQPRPDVRALRALGFRGNDAQVVERAGSGDGHALRLVSSASAMWTANAATVTPSADTKDGRLHVTPANLAFLFHRRIEAENTERVFRTIFHDEAQFSVHAPLPASPQFCDEGAANHTRLTVGENATHLFGWGRAAYTASAIAAPSRHPARQTREATEAVIRKSQLREGLALPWQQSPLGIDAGAFHTDVLAVGTGSLLLLHEYAFVKTPELLAQLAARLGPGFRYELALERELPVRDAVLAYPFNSQLLELPDGSFTIVAPAESRENDAARRFLERVVQSDENLVRSVHYLDVNGSMKNGGGPACLRLRVPMTAAERHAMHPGVLWTPALATALTAWVNEHYRDRLAASDLRDPVLLRESNRALDALTALLGLGSVYEFQRG